MSTHQRKINIHLDRTSRKTIDHPACYQARGLNPSPCPRTGRCPVLGCHGPSGPVQEPGHETADVACEHAPKDPDICLTAPIGTGKRVVLGGAAAHEGLSHLSQNMQGNACRVMAGASLEKRLPAMFRQQASELAVAPQQSPILSPATVHCRLIGDKIKHVFSRADHRWPDTLGPSPGCTLMCERFAPV